MKILYIINSLGTAGAEKLIVETLPLYRDSGVEADVLLLDGTRNVLYEELEAHNCCRIFSLGYGSVYNPMHIMKILRYIRNYDLVHVHLFPAQYFAIAAKRLAFSKKPFVITEHTTSNRRIQSKWSALPEQWIYSGYSKIICITAEVKKIIQNHIKLPDYKLQVIENGTNLETMRLAQPMNKAEIASALTDDDFVLIQVARFKAPKDQATVIRSLLHLPEKVKLLLAGDGALRRDCEAVVEELGLMNRVLFLGIRTDVPTLLKSVDAIVLSSKYEGLSLSSMEGMASGKPFLASNVPGLSEVVGGAGILFPQGDDKTLAKEILKLMDNREHYLAVVAKCIQRATQYDINVMVDKHIALYNSLIGK